MNIVRLGPHSFPHLPFNNCSPIVTPSARCGDKGGLLGSGHTQSQKQAGSRNQEIINESTKGHRQKRS